MQAGMATQDVSQNAFVHGDTDGRRIPVRGCPADRQSCVRIDSAGEWRSFNGRLAPPFRAPTSRHSDQIESAQAAQYSAKRSITRPIQSPCAEVATRSNGTLSKLSRRRLTIF